MVVIFIELIFEVMEKLRFLRKRIGKVGFVRWGIFGLRECDKVVKELGEN